MKMKMKYIIIVIATLVSTASSGCATMQQMQSNLQNKSQEEHAASAIDIIGELIIYSISK